MKVLLKLAGYDAALALILVAADFAWLCRDGPICAVSRLFGHLPLPLRHPAGTGSISITSTPSPGKITKWG